jgi:D-glycero-D-manno-heptose 1,7-bisphosphate phosphatase
MIFRAQREFNINLWSSVLIGDKDSDINAGRAAGIGSLILLRGIYAFTPADDVTLCETLEDAAAGLD